MQSIPLFKKIAFSIFIGFMPALMACAPCNRCVMPAYPYAPEGSYTIERIDAPKAEETVIRAAIDIGSGATKLRIAEVNVKEQKIKKILVDESFTVSYQEHLEKSATKSFDEEVMAVGIESLKKSVEIAKKYHVKKVVAVATAAFRKAANADHFVQKIETETGITVYIIDQDLEGKLAFEAALGQLDVAPSDLVVWDIGGGSFQLTMQSKEGYYDIYRGHLAAVPFKNMIIREIQHKDPEKVKTPNPLTLDEIQSAAALARMTAAKVDRVFKEKIQHATTQVVGVGSVFAYGIAPLLKGQIPFTASQMKQEVEKLAGKTDEDMGGGDFASLAISNPILVLGFMETLEIPRLNIVDVNNADGAFLYEPFWE